MSLKLKNDEPKSARINVLLVPSKKNTWQAEAERRHWTLSMLIEVAVEEFLKGKK